MNARVPDGGKPVVAILTMDDRRKLFRGNRKNFRDIIRTGHHLGFHVYVVTVRNLKLSGPTVLGYVPVSGSRQWNAVEMPLPQVVYNRIPSRDDEKRPSVRRKIEALLEHPSIHLYNPFFFNKWTLFEWLKGSRATVRFVPKTRRLRSAATLQSMLETHDALYLKPEEGKAGKGIMRLKYRSGVPLPYRLQIQSGRKNITYKAATLPRLWARVERETCGERYIVQQAVTLAEHGGRPFDLRLLVQKNGRGGWSLTGIGARLAGARSITTHVPRGGTTEEPKEMLEGMFGPERAASILKGVPSAALLIARQIERAAGFKLGEMSMDLGVDEDGGLWFFEANSRPMKFDEPSIRKLSLERIFQYSQYLGQQEPAPYLERR
ncbi:YheC/YheD family protein [Paenibacillus sp. CN-4]|uniref:YheC/YheD family endospore coat-associated protein n=1 Tax=Paenibacillus nanchangensis TaxID=3348343 RepID=UPI003978043D